MEKNRTASITNVGNKFASEKTAKEKIEYIVT